MADSITGYISEDPPDSSVVYEAITDDSRLVRFEHREDAPSNAEGLFRAEILGRYERGFSEDKLTTAGRTKTSVRWSIVLAALYAATSITIVVYVAGAHLGNIFPESVGPLLPLLVAAFILYMCYRESSDLYQVYTARAVTKVTQIESS